MEEQGRDAGSATTFLAVRRVTRKISNFPSPLPAAREKCDQMVFYHNRWEQKNKYYSTRFSLIMMLLKKQEALLPFRSH